VRCRSLEVIIPDRLQPAHSCSKPEGIFQRNLDGFYGVILNDVKNLVVRSLAALRMTIALRMKLISDGSKRTVPLLLF
jgi:hypothetical protein